MCLIPTDVHLLYISERKCGLGVHALSFGGEKIGHVLKGYVSASKCRSGVHVTESGTWTISGASSIAHGSAASSSVIDSGVVK